MKLKQNNLKLNCGSIFFFVGTCLGKKRRGPLQMVSGSKDQIKLERVGEARESIVKIGRSRGCQ